MARDEVATKREKREGFGVAVNREVPLDQLEAAASVAKFAKSAIAYDSLEEAFPAADPGLIPFHTDVLVQIRTPKKRTRGGLYIPEESRDTELWNTQVGKVIAMGPVAFHNRETMQLWPEGAWCKVGDYVRVPKYGGDRWWMDATGSEDKALFVLFDDLVMKGKIPDDKVLDMVAYI